MKNLIALFLLLASINAFARAGGGHSYSSRSYSRSYSSPRVVHIYHHDSGPGFGTGLILGSMLSHQSAPAPQVVVVDQTGNQATAPAQVVVQQATPVDNGSHWGTVFGIIVFLVVIGICMLPSIL